MRRPDNNHDMTLRVIPLYCRADGSELISAVKVTARRLNGDYKGTQQGVKRGMVCLDIIHREDPVV
jgi:hypothetical protein